MYILRPDTQATAGKALVSMAFTYVYYIVLQVCTYDKEGILVPPYIETFSLAYGIELRPVMPAYNLPVRASLVAGLLYMFLPATVTLCAELNALISHRAGKPD